MVNVGRRTIKACKKAGASAVKFQMWRQKDLYPGEVKFKKYELDFEQARKFNNCAYSEGIDFSCSAFYPEAVEFLDQELKVPWFKVASRTAKMEDPHSLEVVEAIARTKKPVLVSMGYGGNKEALAEVLKGCKIYWLFCVSNYPTKTYDIPWSGAEKYDGFSDHTRILSASIRFVGMKKKEDCIIERHVTLPDLRTPDTCCSISIQDLAYLMTVLTSSSDIPG